MAEPVRRPVPTNKPLLRRLLQHPSLQALAAPVFAIVLTAAIWFALPALEQLWRAVLGGLLANLRADDLVLVATPFTLPVPLHGLALNTTLESPDLTLLSAHIGTALALLLLAGLLPAPLRTALRLLAACHALGTLGSLGFPESAPYSVQEHTAALSLSAELLLLALPLLLALSHWVVERRLARRLGVLALSALWLACALPFKLLLHALLLQTAGGLMMPTLFLVAGPALDVWLLSALYAWAVSWQPPRAESV